MSLPQEVTGKVTRNDNGTNVQLWYSLTGNPQTQEVYTFVHGSGSDHRIWRDQRMHYFTKGKATLAIDLRGSGNSDKPLNSDYSFAMFAADLKAVMDHFGITSTVYFGGNMGAQIGLRFAYDYPGIINTLILAGGQPLSFAHHRGQQIGTDPNGHPIYDPAGETDHPDENAWKYAEFTDEDAFPLNQVWNILLAYGSDPTNPTYAAYYNFFLQSSAARIFPDLCTNIQPLRDYVVECSKATPPFVAARTIGYNNPNAWVYNNLFPVIESVKNQNLRTLIITGTENASFSRGFSLVLYQKLLQFGIPTPGTSNPIIKQFIGIGTFAYATAVGEFNDAVDEFLEYDQYSTKCDTVKLN